MYLEWRLPRGSDAYFVAATLQRNLQDWQDKYKIPYRIKEIKNTLRLTFDDDKSYTLFASSWNPKTDQYQDWMKFSVIDNLNNRPDMRNQV